MHHHLEHPQAILPATVGRLALASQDIAGMIDAEQLLSMDRYWNTTGMAIGVRQQGLHSHGATYQDPFRIRCI